MGYIFIHILLSMFQGDVFLYIVIHVPGRCISIYCYPYSREMYFYILLSILQGDVFLYIFIHVPGRCISIYCYPYSREMCPCLFKGGNDDDTAAEVLRKEYVKLGPMT